MLPPCNQYGVGFTSGQLVRIGFFWFSSVFFGFIDIIYDAENRSAFSMPRKREVFTSYLVFSRVRFFSVFAGFSWFLPVRGDANFVSWILMRFEVFPIGSQAFVGCYAINNGYKMIISVWGRTLGVTIIYTCTPKVPPVFLCIFVVSLDRKLYFKSLIRTLRKNGFQGRKPVFLPKTTTWLSIPYCQFAIYLNFSYFGRGETCDDRHFLRVNAHIPQEGHNP